jgi:hypothetical protein
MHPHEARTYTINSSNSFLPCHSKREADTHCQHIDSTKSKLLQNPKENRKKTSYSSSSAHDLNSASSADEWVDLDDEDLELENEHQNTAKLSTSVVKPAITPHHLARNQNFAR